MATPRLAGKGGRRCRRSSSAA